MNTSPFKPRDILLILIVGCVAGCSYLLTSEIALAPGIQFRLFAFIAPALGILLGKNRGGVTAFFAEGIWAVTAFYGLHLSYALSIATPFAMIGNFFQAFIPGYLVETLSKDKGYSLSLKNLGCILAGAMLGLVVLSLWFGVFFDLLHVTPFVTIIQSLWFSDSLPIIIGTVPVTWALLRIPPVKKQWECRY